MQAQTISIAQTPSVEALKDIEPNDWAYEALRSLSDRYNCIAGFFDNTYRGTQCLTRYEFATGLNSCLNQIERLFEAYYNYPINDFILIAPIFQLINNASNQSQNDPIYTATIRGVFNF